uniref:Transmembrane protein 59 n=1 Tax=Latimeria chalumnae TaxID=7897 RepID=H3AGF0_LATCH
FGKVWGIVFVSFLLVVVFDTVSCDVFDSVLGDTVPCHKSCQMTYTLHTYPKDEELYACQRGCRLFSICQFVDDGIDLNQTKLECESACNEAYSNPDEQYACNLGCQSQLPLAERRQEQLISMMPKIHLLYPLTLVRSIWSDMMNSAQSFISSSWTFYLQADDGKIVIFQSKPQIQYIAPLNIQTEDLNEASLSKGSKSKLLMSMLTRSFLQNCQCRSYPGMGKYVDEKEEHSLFKCLSTNTWLPGWILTTTLILSVAVLVWICCATVATAVDQYVPSEKLSIYGDLEYMNEHKLNPYPSSSLVIISSKSQDKEEVGPLPPKVNLDQSAI